MIGTDKGRESFLDCIPSVAINAMINATKSSLDDNRSMARGTAAESDRLSERFRRRIRAMISEIERATGGDRLAQQFRWSKLGDNLNWLRRRIVGLNDSRPLFRYLSVKTRTSEWNRVSLIERPSYSIDL